MQTHNLNMSITCSNPQSYHANIQILIYISVSNNEPTMINLTQKITNITNKIQTSYFAYKNDNTKITGLTYMIY